MAVAGRTGAVGNIINCILQHSAIVRAGRVRPLYSCAGVYPLKINGVIDVCIKLDIGIALERDVNGCSFHFASDCVRAYNY